MIAIEELEIRRARIADELEKLDMAISAVRTYAAAYAPDMLGAKSVVTEQPRVLVRRSKPKMHLSGKTITEQTADAAWEAMVEAKAPLTLGQIQEAIVAAGVPLGDTDNPKNVIGARLHNSKRFVSTHLGWWIKGEALPDSVRSEPQGSYENGAPEGAPDARGGATPLDL